MASLDKDTVEALKAQIDRAEKLIEDLDRVKFMFNDVINQVPEVEEALRSAADNIYDAVDHARRSLED